MLVNADIDLDDDENYTNYGSSAIAVPDIQG